jgi:radical SAM superfamily enzyme YgiQ (UPF0313 family)
LIKHITFIEPKNDHLHIFSKYELPRLGGILLATIMRERGYSTEALFQKAKDILRRDMSTDLAAISTITPTASSAYAVGDALRARGIPVVYGGPHVSFLPEEALEHGDYCIVGEGETALPALVEALNDGTSLESVPGLVWRDNGRIRSNPAAAHVEDLDSLPFPDFSLLDMGRLTRMGSPMGKSTIPMQTSRGCPFDCSFCSVTPMFGKRYRHRSTQSVIDEMSRYDPRKHFIFFYDDNFTASRSKAKELLHAMIDRKLGFSWSTQVRADVARDPELLDLMREAGCNALYIGFESVDPETLVQMKKGQTQDEIRFAIREIRKRRIHIHGMFVFGFDSDTPEKARATVSFAIKEKIDSAQFMILTPLPGSDTYNALKEQGRIRDLSWDTYDAHHVKFQPARFSPWELQYAQIEAHTRFYSPLQVLRRLVRGRLTGFIVGVYANSLNRRWQRLEQAYLRILRTASAQVLQAPALPAAAPATG